MATLPGRAIPHPSTTLRAVVHYVAMILRPAGRFLTNPFPPGAFAARFLAAVILPPLLFFAILNHLLLFVSFIYCVGRLRDGRGFGYGV
jgi:hypothetical protein